MAKVVWVPGVDPVNDGERRVIDAFADRLAPSVQIFPNVQIRLSPYQLVECDQLILTEDRLWVIEVKDLYGDVAFLKGQHIVDGDVRPDAVDGAQLKAKRLKKRLVAAGVADGVFVEFRVVLAKAPKKLHVDPEYDGFVLSIEAAADLIGDPTGHGLPKRHLEPDHRAAIVTALSLQPRRVDLRPKFGNIEAEELLAEDASRRLWAAREVPLGKPWHVEIPLRRAGVSDTAWAADQEAILGRVRMLQALAGEAGILVPHTVVRADAGTLGIVHPVNEYPTLADHGDGITQWSDAVRRRVLQMIVRAVAACHRRAVAHRLIGPTAIRVDADTGRAWLTDFSRVLRTGDVDTAPALEWPELAEGLWAAPEHFAGGPVDAAADLFALGGLAQDLWPEGLPADLAGPVKALTSAVPSERSAGRDAMIAALVPKAAGRSLEPAEGVTWAGYRLEERLGLAVEPGVSVWRAVAVLTGQQVVVRIYEAEADLDGATVLATALQGVSHPNLAPVLAAALHEGRAYVVTELVTGPSLRVANEQAGPLGPHAAVSAAVQVLGALAAVHPGRSDGRPAILHRRVSPDNVIVRPDGAAVLVNFGPPATGSSQVAVNDARYRPPNEAIEVDDPDPDLFAVGILIHEVAAGRHPFAGDDPFAGDLQLASELGSDLASALHRALAVERSVRFSSAAEFQGALIALGLPEVELPQVAEDILDIRRRIDAALRERRWEDAEAACPEAWVAVRQRILADRERWNAAEQQSALLNVEGFRLRFVREEKDVVVALPSEGDTLGDDRIYLADRDDGTALTIAVFRSAQGAGIVRVTEVLHGDAALRRLQQGLRIGIRGADEGGLTMDLRQAQFVAEPQPGKHPISQYLVTEPQLHAGAGVDVREVLMRFGAVGFGTRAEVFGETGKKRNELCVAFPTTATDLPAVAYLLTRIAPVVRGVKQKGS